MAVELQHQEVLAELIRMVPLPRAQAEGCTLMGTATGRTVRRLMTARDLKDEYGLDPKTIAEWEKDPNRPFPQRRQMSPTAGGKVAWDRLEVEAWWDSLPRGVAGSKSAQDKE